MCIQVLSVEAPSAIRDALNHLLITTEALNITRFNQQLGLAWAFLKYILLLEFLVFFEDKDVLCFLS